MGGAFIEGLLCSGFNPKDITGTCLSEQSLQRLKGMGVNATFNNIEAVSDADLVVFAVKHWPLESIIQEVSGAIDRKRQCIVSFAASVSAERLSQLLEADGISPKTYIVIPNIALAVLNSMTFIVPVKGDEETDNMLKDLFGRMGSVMFTDENHLKAGTVLASCGIAYALRYIRASSEGGVELGFKASEAERIVAQTVKGAANLLLEKGNHPEQEIDKVTTPGGLTIKGLNEMENAGFTSAVIRGLKAVK